MGSGVEAIFHHFAVEGKQALKNRLPRVALGDLMGQFRGCLLGKLADGFGNGGREGGGGVFRGPMRLPAVDDAVHVAAANADHWSATGLRLQGDKAEGLLETRVDEEIGGSANWSGGWQIGVLMSRRLAADN